MDRSVLSISNEEAERIKKDVAKQYEKLRESLQSTGNKEDKSSFTRNHPTQGQISEAERIKEASSQIIAKLRESISSSEGRKLSKFAVGANIEKEVNIDKQSNVDDHVLYSGKEEVNGANSGNERNKSRGVRSFTKLSDASNAEVDSTVDSSVNKSNQNCSILYSEAIRGSSLLSRKEGCTELIVQLEEDVSPIIIDYTNPLPSTSSDVDLSSRSLSNNVLKSGSPTRYLKGICSESVECVSETEMSLDSGGKSGVHGKEVSASQSVGSHSWENFAAHLVAIRANINLRDLFIHGDLTIFDIFTGLSMQAQAVFIQLLNSEYTWYRESRLVTSGDDDLNNEMGRELKSVIDTLIEKRLLIADTGDEKNDLLIRLLSTQELKNVCRLLGLRDDGKCPVLIKSLIEFSNKQKIMDRVARQDCKDNVRDQVLKVLGRVIKLNHAPRELFLRTQLLYALPLTKTMTVDGRVPLITIMNDVCTGKISYPDYTLEPLRKLFPSRESLVRFQQALHLEANIKWRMKLKKFDEVTHLHESAFIQFEEELKDEHASEWSAGLPNCLRTFTRGTVLARAVHQSVECLRVKKMYTKMISAYETLLSQDLYLKLYKGMWYDELAKIYHSVMKDVSKTIIFLTEALADPSLNYIDRVLLSDRVSPIVSGKKRKRSQIYEELKPMLSILKDIPEISIDARCFDAKIDKEKKFSYIYETVEGVGQILSSPEEVIRLHFKRSGYSHGVHSPFVIGSSIFGILFWDVIYQTKVPNVFLCPFQILPLDLTSGEFYTNRESQVKTRIAQIKELWSEHEMYDHVRKTWTKEEGKKSIVSWKIFQDLDQFEVMLRCIGRQMLTRICEKMSKDFHLLQKGFPSMILWNQTTKTCKFIQVKEPNSHLTPSQKTWLLHLIIAGGDAFACCVNPVGSKPPKRKPDPPDDSTDLDESMEIDCAY